jgi:hypothetical protein
MVFEDPKTTILKLLRDNFRVLKDDGSATLCQVVFELPEQEIISGLDKFDITITIGRENEKARRIATVAYFEYRGTYRVGVWTKDKLNMKGEDVCTSSIQKIKEIIKVNEHKPGGNLTFLKKVNTRDDDRVGSPMLYHRLVMVETTHYGQEQE